MKDRFSPLFSPFRQAAIILISISIAYLIIIDAPLHFDAQKAILELTHLHELTDFSSIINFDPYLPRPLFHFSLALNIYLFNGASWGFHLINLLWHLAAVMLFWRLVENLHKSDDHAPLFPFAAALFFGLHPVLTESVAYTWGGSGIMSAFFMTAAMLAYLRARKGGITGILALAISLLFFIAALAAKETAAILPVLIVAIELTENDGSKPMVKTFRALPFFVVPAILLSWRIHTYGAIAFPYEGSYIDHLARQVCVAVGYIRLLAWPHGLSLEHRVPDTYPLARVSVCLLFLAVIVVSTFYSLKKKNLFRYAGVFFIAGLSPFFLIPLKDRMVERNLYVPAMGFALFLAASVCLSRTRWKNTLAIIIALCLFTGTLSRNRLWTDERSIWVDAAKNAPLLSRPIAQVGALAMVDGNNDIARRILERAVAINPKDADAHNNLGVLYTRLGDPMRAEYEFSVALNSDNDHMEAHMNYVHALLKRGDKRKAEKQLKKLLKRFPRLLEANLLLGDIYRLDNRAQDAMKLFQNVLNSSPDDPAAHLGIGLTELQAGKMEEALTSLRKAKEYGPEDPRTHRALGMLHMRSGDFEKAAANYEKAYKLAPGDSPDIVADWGIALMRAGHLKKAWAVFSKERDLRPDDPMPYLRLASVAERMKKYEEALSLYRTAVSKDKYGRYKKNIEESIIRVEGRITDE